MVVEKLKGDKIKLSKSARKSPKKQKVKGNKFQSGNKNVKNKTKDKKYYQTRLKYKWKMEYTKEGYAQTKSMNKKTSH